jgi:hypothetical protein
MQRVYLDEALRTSSEAIPDAVGPHRSVGYAVRTLRAGSANRPARPIVCRARPSESMPAGPGLRPAGHSAMMRRPWVTMPGSAPIRVLRPIQSVRSGPTPGDSMTCTATSGSGSKTSYTLVTMEPPLTAVPGKMPPARTGWSVGVPAPTRATAVARTVACTRSAPAMSAWASVVPEFRRREPG